MKVLKIIGIVLFSLTLITGISISIKTRDNTAIGPIIFLIGIIFLLARSLKKKNQSTEVNIINQLKLPFYLRTGFIVTLSFFWMFFIPGILALIFTNLQRKRLNERFDVLIDEERKITTQYCNQKSQNNSSNDTQQANRIVELARLKAKEIIESAEHMVNTKMDAESDVSKLSDSIVQLQKKEAALINKINILRISQKSIKDSIEFYRDNQEYNFNTEEVDLMYPSVIIPLHSHDVKSLKEKANRINKEIKTLLDSYHSRYTTKANRSIYELIVLSLQAELQNILSGMKFGSVEKSRDLVKSMCIKYSKIANDGNQSISSTLIRFIGEIESLFLSLVEIEYEYYVKREQEKEEQRLLKEQIRQEAEEMKRLQEEKKRIDNEEKKYNNEILNIENALKETNDNSKIQELEKRLLELQNQVSELESKREEIVNLQNGKAGNVYVISNIGSFGENVFKIGMTRRLEPIDRVKELSSASVPFPFDVHSFIFSEDAPALENKIHNILNEKRVNKVNPRKEFFKVTVDELESLVSDLDPTAEFKKTIHAHEFYNSSQIDNELVS